MNNPLDPTLRELNNCDCCTGTSAETPMAIENRPGLSAIAFRAGVQSQFKATLLAALSSQSQRELSDLRTRDDDDFSIALLDAFACMADVLTFYSERVANEAYLRTATERRSVLEMARAIGYELSPGVAAKVMLAFTIDEGTGATGTAIIPEGTKVQSIPGPGENPQVYETSAEFSALAAWNELKPRQRESPPAFSALPAASELYLEGTSTNIKIGNILVLSSGTEARAKRVIKVETDSEQEHTYVELEETPASLTAAPAKAVAPPPALQAKTTAGSAAPLTSLSIGADPTATTVNSIFIDDFITDEGVYAISHYYGWDSSKVQEYLNSLSDVTLPTPREGVFALRSRAGFFGHNAPRWASLPLTEVKVVDTDGTELDVIDTNVPYPVSWDPGQNSIWQDSQSEDLDVGFDVLLERPIPEIIKDSWIALEMAGQGLEVFRVGSAAELSRADYGMSGRCMGLQLQIVTGQPISTKNAAFKNRFTTAHVQSEGLTVLGAPKPKKLVAGPSTLELDTIDMNLTVGQTLALKGENADLPETYEQELIVIKAILHQEGVTILTLEEGLKHSYVRSTVTINGNVVAGTHGETTEEVLGSGDSTQTFQYFKLKQDPLTYAFAPDGSVLESSLEIWVDDVQWTEVENFFGRGPKDRVYIVRLADDGKVTVKFGDGETGARLPTGRENVRAVYRKGIGLDGIVSEDQIGLLLSQPLGVRSVTNPLEPEGAEDPQTLDDSRINAPRTVLTLDRVVSLQDYEDFARDYPGVDKAHAVWTWNGSTRGVLLTLLGPDGAEINPTGQPADPLRKALANQGNARVPVKLLTRPASLFEISGTVRVDADRVASVVEEDVRAALLEAFSFDVREFGQGVHISEVIAVIQNVAGVAFVDVTGFLKTMLVGTAELDIEAEHGYLSAHKPVNGTDADIAEPAELLILSEISLSQLEFLNL